MKQKANRKKNQEKKKSSATRKTASKAKLPTKAKAKIKQKPKRKAPRAAATVQRGSQTVETVSPKRKAPVARTGAGAGDYDGISTVAAADSESGEELLEEGQAFEAGIIRGVENAPDPDEAEVTTHEVPQDDVPSEYEDKDRP